MIKNSFSRQLWWWHLIRKEGEVLGKNHTFRVITNGKVKYYQGHERETSEGIVRGIMCWYSTGTIFVVIDPEYRVSIFQKVHSDDPVKGYSELVDYLEMLGNE